MVLRASERAYALAYCRNDNERDEEESDDAEHNTTRNKHYR
jgi:hypothetical protein